LYALAAGESEARRVVGVPDCGALRVDFARLPFPLAETLKVVLTRRGA
jgi:hypothetical protein